MEEEIIGNRWKELDYVDRKPRKSTTGGLSILLTCRSSVNHFHTFPIPFPIPFLSRGVSRGEGWERYEVTTCDPIPSLSTRRTAALSLHV